jgi:Icc-related predicted phosphoesterase
MCERQGITYLQGELVSIEGVKFYGYPWQPVFRWMSFNAKPGELRGRLKLVPDDTQVLITHGPAYQIFDWIPDIAEHVGCFDLAKRIEQLSQLKAHICGHIHEGYGFGVRESDGLKFANASTCNERYKPVNPPIIIDL